jgi:hypothetical protein
MQTCNYAGDHGLETDANDATTCADEPVREGVVVAPAPAPAAAEGGGAEEVATCIICLDKEPPPIQLGCACRGDAGLAECRVQAAEHRMMSDMTSGNTIDGWWRCGTCGQEFTGAMQLGLAQAWWSSAQHLSQEDDQRLSVRPWFWPRRSLSKVDTRGRDDVSRDSCGSTTIAWSREP